MKKKRLVKILSCAIALAVCIACLLMIHNIVDGRQSYRKAIALFTRVYGEMGWKVIGDESGQLYLVQPGEYSGLLYKLNTDNAVYLTEYNDVMFRLKGEPEEDKVEWMISNLSGVAVDVSEPFRLEHKIDEQWYAMPLFGEETELQQLYPGYRLSGFFPLTAEQGQLKLPAGDYRLISGCMEDNYTVRLFAEFAIE